MERHYTDKVRELDAIVVGAGFAGLYMLYRLRDILGLRVAVIEAADDVGGTWYWNRYPGARCDIESVFYSYSFDDQLEQEWEWSEKYPAQEEILSYLNHVADRFDLRRDIKFETRVTSAKYDEAQHRWIIATDRGDTFSASYFIPASGVLSSANVPKFKNDDKFAGRRYYSFAWPREGVSFKGKRVGIIGTGATGIQIIPVVAEEAAHLTVFQRSANYAGPLRNRPLTPAERRETKAKYRELRRQCWNAFAGVPFDTARPSALAESGDERQKHYEACWAEGGFNLWLGSYSDILMDVEANETAAKFVREKIRERVKDPAVADILCPPAGTPYGTKRQPCETDYYEAFNRENVALVDINAHPIEEFTENGICTSDGREHQFDCLIYATGFDAFTGSLFKMNIQGRDGKSLKDHWSAGPRTLMGFGTEGFPNMFIVTGPMSPTVIFNMPLGIEQNCEWISDCITFMRRNGVSEIEVDGDAEDRWIAHVEEVASHTLLPKTESWYVGANIPGKPRLFMIYMGGGKRYKHECDEVALNGYRGFKLKRTKDLARAHMTE